MRRANAKGLLLLDVDILLYILKILEGNVMAGAKAQLVKWGNSQAVRIPKTILEQANLREGEELEIRVENGYIWLEAMRRPLTTAGLVGKISPKNRHGGQDWGETLGRE